MYVVLTLETFYSSDEGVRDQLRNYVALRAHAGLAWHAVDWCINRSPLSDPSDNTVQLHNCNFFGGEESVLQHNILIFFSKTHFRPVRQLVQMI